jgi:hypothetical protein
MGRTFGYASGPPQPPKTPRKGGDRRLRKPEVADSIIGE